MLFLPDSVYRSRQRLLKQRDAGKMASEAMYQQMLELDPNDHIALFELGMLAEKAGDHADAEEYYWRAIESHPWAYQSHLALSQFLGKDPEQQALSAGLGELGLRKLMLDHEALHDVASRRWDIPAPGLDKLAGLSKREQFEYFAEVFGRQQVDEPAEVTARLRPHRFAHQVQESAIDSESTVNGIIAEGPLIAPLLQGLLRGVAQDYLDNHEAAERAMALLGEIGDPAVLPDLLEFASLEDDVLSGVAGWAMDRLISLDPHGAAAVLNDLSSELDIYGRTVVAVKLIKHPDMDPDGTILLRLMSGLQKVEKSERETLVFAVVHGLLGRGGSGAGQARQVLSQNAALLSPKMRAMCEDEVRSVEDGGAPPYQLPDDPEITVYDICGGEVNWEEDEDDEGFDDAFDEEEEDDWIPKPVRKAAMPGRNDPCWCGSGKKYKKCHLAADEQA